VTVALFFINSIWILVDLKYEESDVNKNNNLFTSLFIYVYCVKPVTVAERSKACPVFARTKAGIMGSNPTQGMDV
jgi:hypothetical protein